MESPINDANHTQSEEHESFIGQLEESLAYGSSYVESKIDKAENAAKHILKSALGEIVSVVFQFLILLIAIAFFMYGAAVLLSRVIGDDFGLGFLLVGGGFIIAIAVSSQTTLNFKRKTSIKEKIKKLETQLAHQRKKFGHDMMKIANVQPKKFKNERDFLIWKSNIAKAAFIKVNHNLKNQISTTVDTLIQNHPLETFGAAGAVGFVSASRVKSQTVTETVKVSSEKSILETIAQVATIEILRQSVIPFVTEQMTSLSKDSSENSQANGAHHPL